MSGGVPFVCKVSSCCQNNRSDSFIMRACHAGPAWGATTVADITRCVSLIIQTKPRPLSCSPPCVGSNKGIAGETTDARLIVFCTLCRYGETRRQGLEHFVQRIQGLPRATCCPTLLSVRGAPPHEWFARPRYLCIGAIFHSPRFVVRVTCVCVPSSSLDCRCGTCWR